MTRQRGRSSGRAARARASAALAGLALLTACGTTSPQLTDATDAAASGGVNQSSSNADDEVAGTVRPGGASGSASSPGASSTGSGTGGSSASGTGGSAPASIAPGAIENPTECDIPETGPGWDAERVYVGGALQTDAATVGRGIGFNAFDFGDQEAMARAVNAELNETGGLCGREVVPVYYDVNSVNDTNQEAQAACTRWTQDQRVVSASLVPNINIPNMYACMSEAGVPISTLTGSPSLLESLSPYRYLVLKNTVMWDRFVDVWIDRLTGLGYFEPWDTSAGTSGVAPVKVAILTGDDPIAVEAWKTVEAELKQRNIEVSDFVVWNDPSQFSSYVLRFRSNGVTHLFIDRLAGVFYPSQAQSQNYYARYALTSQNFIQPFLGQGPAPQQLRGAMGVGWHPHLDVQQAQDPGPTAGFEACMALMQRRGIDVSKRNYQFTATASCDGVEHFKRAVAAGRGFAPEQLVAGLRAAAPTMPYANVFGASGHGDEPGFLSVVRDLLYDDACSCVRYASGDITIP